MCLMRHDYAMAAQFQSCIMRILDALNGAVPMSRTTRTSLFTSLGDSLEGMADQVRQNSPAVAERYEADSCARWQLWTEVCISFSSGKYNFMMRGIVHWR